MDNLRQSKLLKRRFKEKNQRNFEYFSSFFTFFNSYYPNQIFF